MEVVEGVYPRFRFPRHAHPHFTFSVLTAGGQRFEHRGRTTLLRGGDVVLLNPDEAHANAPISQSWSHISLCFSEATVAEVAPEFCGKRIAIGATVVRDQAISLRLVELAHSHGRAEFELAELALQVVDTVFRKHCRTAPPRITAPSVDTVRERLLDAPEINVSLVELSRIAGMSVTSLLRSFTKACGCTPHTFQTALRIDRSKRLLRAGYEIADVASIAGFVDQSHFTHTFKRWLGITPARYHEQVAHRDRHQSERRQRPGLRDVRSRASQTLTGRVKRR
jgi:AraC-like DNA-binding protein